MSESLDIDVRELAPDIHRVEFVRDGKRHGYHLLFDEDRTVVIDSGYKDTPETVYGPVLSQFDRSLADVGLLLVTHADADHHGGNHALRKRAPKLTIAAHHDDVGLIEDAERLMTDRYGRFREAHDVGYDDVMMEALRDMVSPNDEVDVHLSGGERVRVADRTLRLLHTPGHTAGHLILYDPRSGLVIGGDAFFGRGLVGVDGDVIQPPPYYRVSAYTDTVQLVDSLNPEVLSFTHYDVLRGDEIEDFIGTSRAYVAETETLAEALLHEHGPVTLTAAIDEAVARRGSYGLDVDLAASLSAHFDDLVRRGVASTMQKDGRRAWEPA